MGEVTPEALAFFQRLSRPINYGDGIRPTELYVTEPQTRPDYLVPTLESSEYQVVEGISPTVCPLLLIGITAFLYDGSLTGKSL